MDPDNPVDFKIPSSVAALWSTMLPGVGQLMQNRPMPGVVWAAAVGVGYYAFFWPGLVLHSLCVLDAGLRVEGGWTLKNTSSILVLLVVLTVLIGYIVYRNF